LPSFLLETFGNLSIVFNSFGLEKPSITLINNDEAARFYSELRYAARHYINMHDLSPKPCYGVNGRTRVTWYEIEVMGIPIRLDVKYV
jgi:hypothetical protein